MLASRASMGLRATSLPTRTARSVVVVRADGTPPISGGPAKPFVPAGRDWMYAQPGVSQPMGFFDPIRFTDNTAFTVDEAKRFRESELAHCRVAMLAALGWVVAEEVHPLFGGQIDGPAFVHFQKVEAVLPQFWEIILFCIAIAEGFRISKSYNDPRMEAQIKEDHQPGNLGFDPLGFYPKDKKAQYDMRTKELNNGRLAMLAVAGFAAQEEVDHQTIWKGLVGSD